MALSPADFYAYSRATGVEIPEDPQEKAAMAPEVLEFRRNQLKAPQQESNPLQFLGTSALAVGATIGAGLAARRFLGRGQQIPKGPAKSATAGVTQADLDKLQTAAGRKTQVNFDDWLAEQQRLERQQVYETVAAKSAEELPPIYRPKGDIQEDVLITSPITGEIYKRGQSPQGTSATYVAPSKEPGEIAGFTSVSVSEALGDPTDKLLRELGEMQAARKKELTSRMSQAYGQRLQKTADELIEQLRSETVDLTTLQNATENLQRAQFAGAVESGEDQMTGRIKSQLQRNEDYDMSQVEMLENIASQNQPQVIGYEPDAAINQAASQLPDGLPVDQAELLTTKKPKYFIRERVFQQPGARLQEEAKKTQRYQTPTPVSVIGRYPPAPQNPPSPYVKFPGQFGSSTGEAIVVSPVEPVAGLTNIRRGNVEFTATEARLGPTGRPARFTVLPLGTPTEGRTFTGSSTPTMSADEMAAKLTEMQLSQEKQIQNTMARGLSEARAKRNIQLSESQRQAIEESLPGFSPEDLMSRTGVVGYGDILEAERFAEEQTSKSGRLKALEEGGFLEEQIDPGQLRVAPQQVRPGVMIRPASKTSYRGMTGRPGFGIYGEQAPGTAGTPGFGAGAVEARKIIKTEGEERGVTTPRAFIPGVDDPQMRTPEGFVYTEEAMTQPTQARGGYRRYGTQPPTRPEAALEAFDASRHLRQLQQAGRFEEAQAFVDKMKEERGITALGQSQPLRQPINRRGKFGA
jgi:hypothetical protein